MRQARAKQENTPVKPAKRVGHRPDPLHRVAARGAGAPRRGRRRSWMRR